MPVLVQRFYKEVRNPLFHGYELASLNVAGTPAVENASRDFAFIPSIAHYSPK